MSPHGLVKGGSKCVGGASSSRFKVDKLQSEEVDVTTSQLEGKYTVVSRHRRWQGKELKRGRAKERKS